MDISALLKLSGAMTKFSLNHPKFPEFLKAAKAKGITEGMMIDIQLTYPDGTCLKSGIKVKSGDVELLNSLTDTMNTSRDQ